MRKLLRNLFIIDNVMQSDIIKELGEIALGSRLKRLSDTLLSSVLQVYRAHNIDFEPKWFAITYLLSQNGSMTIQEIADSLQLTHPAVVQFTQQMEKKKLAKTTRPDADKRKKLVELTAKGSETFNSLKPVVDEISVSVAEIFNEINQPVMAMIDSFEQALKRESFYERINSKIKKRQLKEARVITYDEKYKNYFAELNYDWLEKYFFVESEDVKVLSNPKEEIIDKGGEIFFAVYEDDIVGTCAAIKISNDVYELSKMAVTEKARGKQIGKKLALAAIGFAASKNAEKIILETSRKLTAAVNLYESLGFVYVHPGEEQKYNRTNIRMELPL